MAKKIKNIFDMASEKEFVEAAKEITRKTVNTKAGDKNIEEEAKQELKILRVSNKYHQQARINAAKKGLSLQKYIEDLIEKDN